jgi:6-phosphogluconolactonase
MNEGVRHLVTVADPDALARAAADRLVARLAANPARAAVCLTGGSGPTRLYQLLAGEPWRGRIAWDCVHWFVGDDRFVPLDDPLSNMGTAKRTFLDRCAPADHVHPMPTDASSPDEAARRYETLLNAFYGAERIEAARPLFDLVLMGLGPDGHTASLFPGYPAVDETTRWAVGVPQAHVEPFVPRVTLTLPALNSCREMLFLVHGERKRGILSRVMSDDTLPAARAKAEGETIWLVDRAAHPDSAHG